MAKRMIIKNVDQPGGTWQQRDNQCFAKAMNIINRVNAATNLPRGNDLRWFEPHPDLPSDANIRRNVASVGRGYILRIPDAVLAHMNRGDEPPLDDNDPPPDGNRNWGHPVVGP